MMTDRRFLLVEDLITELRFDATAPKNPRKACLEWLARKAVPVKKRGRWLLIERHAVEAALNP